MANHPNRSKASERDLQLITDIAKRGARLSARYGTPLSAPGLAAVMLKAHELVPLDLERLLKADDGNFGHDVFGCWRHIEVPDVGPAVMGGCFLPRFTARVPKGWDKAGGPTD